MADLWVLMPSRGRPHSVERAVDTYARTCRASTLIHFGFDADDPDLDANLKAAGDYHLVDVRPRMGLAAWTNELASLHLDDSAYLGSFGDDHVPMTDGWDAMLITAIEHDSGGIGMSYPDDRLRTDIPEAVVISTPIVRALGWMANPACDHWYIDNTWGDLGRGAGCLTFCRHVIVEHLRPEKWTRLREVPWDDTYREAWKRLDQDGNAYRRWRLTGMRRDIDTIKELRSARTA